MRVYKDENIQKALSLLNEIEVKGINNAQRVVQIAAVLLSDEKEEDIKKDNKENGGKQ